MWHTVALLLSLICFGDLVAVKIVNIKVPEIIQYGGQESVVLDCDYVISGDTTGLVVKWFFKNKTRPVYQWIPPKNPQELGILRGKVDLSFKVTDEPLQMYRAMRIVKPGTELSGEYTCVVSTFMDEDQETRQMIVFVPEKNFRLIQNKLEGEYVKVICSAEGMYPIPNVTIATSERRLDGVETTISLVGGRYAVTASVTLEDAALASPTEFICVLRIPQANYVVRKEAIYYPGPISTTPEMPTAADMQLSASRASGDRCFMAVLLILMSHLLRI